MFTRLYLTCQLFCTGAPHFLKFIEVPWNVLQNTPRAIFFSKQSQKPIDICANVLSSLSPALFPLIHTNNVLAGVHGG